MSAVADALSGAVDVLARQGWRQGARPADQRGRGLTGPLDISEAIVLACPARGLAAVHMTAVGYLADWIDRGNPDAIPVSWRDPEDLSVSVDAWQDAPGRTLAEVVRALRGAARLACPHRHRVPVGDVPGALLAAAALVESSAWRLTIAGSYQALCTVSYAVYTALSGRSGISVVGMDKQVATCAIAVMADRLSGRRYLPWRALAAELRCAARIAGAEVPA